MPISWDPTLTSHSLKSTRSRPSASVVTAPLTRSTTLAERQAPNWGWAAMFSPGSGEAPVNGWK